MNTYSGEGVNALVCALTDMQNTNIIYADGKLGKVLQCLAYYGEFKSALAFCNQGFDYNAEKKKALTTSGNRAVLRLPKHPKTLVAFVVQLLLEFDAGTLDLMKFVIDYFPDNSKQGSYLTFFERVMTPFKHAIVDFAVNGVGDEPIAIEREVDFAPDGLSQQTEYLIVNMYNTVRECGLDSEERENFCVMIEGFAAALDARDSLMIRAIWLGLRGALRREKLCAKEIAEIDQLLRLYLVSR
ncbi:MAG: hypothetical protein NC037_05645 [Bacteroides sp.]|nr:hypothetical protein [Bacillota bacterium]MCM1394240.1 hypothetical protein [[Eubacterium] siraeum]MCM1455989.1 hypothetical protein [Bacteroides sp.]